MTQWVELSLSVWKVMGLNPFGIWIFSLFHAHDMININIYFDSAFQYITYIVKGSGYIQHSFHWPGHIAQQLLMDQ